MTARHTPVLLNETLEALQITAGAWYLDATFGRGGHTEAILAQSGSVIAFDWDAEAISFAEETFAEQIAAGRLIMVHSSFGKLEEEVKKLRTKYTIEKVMSVLFDFGTSSNQLTSGVRGFSLMEDGPLDMRMDQRLGVTAADLLAVLPEKQLADLFIEFGGEHDAKRIAKAIKLSRTPITTTAQLANLIGRTKSFRGGLHPATKVFQALRIAVNSELDEIDAALPQALEIIAPGGRVVTIAFHDGEDSRAKHTFKACEEQGRGTMITKKPTAPSEAEVAANPRSRSAKLRIFEKSN